MKMARHSRIAGVSAVAGGMLAAAFAQFAVAPAAHADVTALINELDGTLAIAQTASENALTSFTDGNIPYGLDYEFGALDTSLLSTLGDLVYGGYESLEGVAGPYDSLGFYYAVDPVPMTLTAATTDFTTDLTAAGTYFTDAATALGSGEFLNGAFDTFYAVGALAEGPEAEIIGLADLLGSSL